ncbi:hypothetical protein H5410_018542 [Solanum commersonii]|uniref:Uncharacterized protein n=1 Tax=Solanum commersonii TaxID=4109 RepID=A0A9J6A283_SOLCO|nr:hypothetical protein H5410_018542 [Solanum commersonii]
MGPTPTLPIAFCLISSLHSPLTKPNFLTRGSNQLVRTLNRNTGEFSSIGIQVS